MVTCNNCGMSNFDGASYCVKCGKKLFSQSIKTCCHCGNINPVGASYCGKCGENIADLTVETKEKIKNLEIISPDISSDNIDTNTKKRSYLYLFMLGTLVFILVVGTVWCLNNYKKDTSDFAQIIQSKTDTNKISSKNSTASDINLRLKKTLLGETGVSSIKFSPNGKMFMATCVFSGEAGVWDANTWQFITSINLDYGMNSSILGFSPDSALVAIANPGERTVLLYDTRTWNVKKIEGIYSWVHSDGGVSYSPYGLVAFYEDNGVIVYDFIADRVNYKIDIPGSRYVAFPQIGEWAILETYSKIPGTYDEVISLTVIDRITGKVIKKIAPNGFVLTISNDGKLVVTVSENDRKEISLHIWDTSTWLEKTAVKSDLLSFQSAAISPENDYLILSGHISDHTSVLELWNLTNNKKMQTIPASSYWVAPEISFSPNGKYVVTADVFDGTVKVWDVIIKQKI